MNGIFGIMMGGFILLLVSSLIVTLLFFSSYARSISNGMKTLDHSSEDLTSLDDFD